MALEKESDEEVNGKILTKPELTEEEIPFIIKKASSKVFILLEKKKDFCLKYYLFEIERKREKNHGFQV